METKTAKAPAFAYVFPDSDNEEEQSIGRFPAYAVPRVGELVVDDTGGVRPVVKVAWFIPNGNTDCVAMVYVGEPVVDDT